MQCFPALLGCTRPGLAIYVPSRGQRSMLAGVSYVLIVTNAGGAGKDQGDACAFFHPRIIIAKCCEKRHWKENKAQLQVERPENFRK